MIEGIITTPQTLATNSSAITFIDDIRTNSANCSGWLQHTNGSPLYKVIKGGIYEIEFTGTLTSETTGTVAIGLYEDGILSPATTAAETIAAAGELANISFNKKIRVCCRGDATISVASIPSIQAGSPLVATTTQIPIITAATFSIKKIA